MKDTHELKIKGWTFEKFFVYWSGVCSSGTFLTHSSGWRDFFVDMSPLQNTKFKSTQNRGR